MRKLVYSMLACSLLLGGACGEDPPTGGSGGTGGSAGRGGSGGSGGTGGTGGSGGSGGSGGVGGSGGSGGRAVDARPADRAPDRGADRPGGDMGRRDGGSTDAAGNAAVTFPGTHPLCPGCKSIFNGVDLDGWTAVSERYEVQDGAIVSTGVSRGVLVSKGSYQDFRMIFTYKKLPGANHKANMIVFCQVPNSGTCGGVQFQPPGGDLWDYRPGAPNNGNLGPPKETGRGANVPDGQWGQCEILAKGSVGTFRTACCLLGETNKTCQGTETKKFDDGKPVKGGPVAFQAHERNHKIAWKDVFIEENPAVDDLITTK